MKIIHLLYNKSIDNGMSKCTNFGPHPTLPYPPAPTPSDLLGVIQNPECFTTQGYSET